jgi:hypothetical protein
MQIIFSEVFILPAAKVLAAIPFTAGQWCSYTGQNLTTVKCCVLFAAHE